MHTQKKSCRLTPTAARWRATTMTARYRFRYLFYFMIGPCELLQWNWRDRWDFFFALFPSSPLYYFFLFSLIFFLVWIDVMNEWANEWMNEMRWKRRWKTLSSVRKRCSQRRVPSAPWMFLLSCRLKSTTSPLDAGCDSGQIRLWSFVR